MLLLLDRARGSARQWLPNLATNPNDLMLCVAVIQFVLDGARQLVRGRTNVECGGFGNGEAAESGVSIWRRCCRTLQTRERRARWASQRK